MPASLSSTSHELPPTAKQLAFLRDLASRAGMAAGHPRTRSEASRRIDQLKAAAAQLTPF